MTRDLRERINEALTRGVSLTHEEVAARLNVPVEMIRVFAKQRACPHPRCQREGWHQHVDYVE